MSRDPWSRPTMDDLKTVLESIGQEVTGDDNRAVDRLELSVPAEVITSRGNTISAVTREISRFGLGILHRGAIQPGEVVVKMASESREFEYRVELKWCTPCDNGMFISGGEFLGKDQASK
ncbi:MAG: PilZ domain-containing protein [Planctomycetaceae bacterium]|nr:PilZ domain-containing protein [Planctomycetaceae bacterium]